MARAVNTSGAASTDAMRGRADGDVRPGMVIAGRYRLERPIGTGGMATIWEGTHLTLNRSIAIKFIELTGPHSSKIRDRFLREARVAAAVRHRNVVDIIDFGTTEDGRPFMVMELLVGISLADRLDGGPPMSVGEAVRIVARVLSGLAAVHDAGIVHRDLKPENVYLVEDADGVYPKLLDFGVSRATDPRSDLESVLPTVENAIVGTPQFMSPEQARGLKNLDHRSDLWSAGVMLYELLSGQLPFDAEAPGDVIIQIATQNPPEFAKLRPDLAGPVADVITKAMRRDPAQRFQSAREMRTVLLEAVARTAAAIQREPSRAERLGQESDLPPVAARELMTAVGDAYEPGDSAVVDLSEHLEQLRSFGDSPNSGLRPVHPRAGAARRRSGAATLAEEEPLTTAAAAAGTEPPDVSVAEAEPAADSSSSRRGWLALAVLLPIAAAGAYVTHHQGLWDVRGGTIVLEARTQPPAPATTEPAAVEEEPAAQLEAPALPDEPVGAGPEAAEAPGSGAEDSEGGAEPSEHEAQSEPGPIVVTLAGVPDGATIRVDGEPVEAAIVDGAATLELARGSEAHEVEVVANDDRTWSVEHATDQDRTYEVELPTARQARQARWRRLRRIRRLRALRRRQRAGSEAAQERGAEEEGRNRQLVRDPGF